MWEGGTRGLAFVHGQMLEKRGYTNTQLFHVTDWLPSLVAIAGGVADMRLYKDIDGMNLLGSLLRNETSTRTEILHDMNSVTNSTALRVGAFKILWGKTEQTLGGWYSGGEVRISLPAPHQSHATVLCSCTSDLIRMLTMVLLALRCSNCLQNIWCCLAS